MTPRRVDGPSLRQHQVNWLTDKLLLTIIGFFVVRTFTSMDALSATVNDLVTKVQLHEQTLTVLKALNHLQ